MGNRVYVFKEFSSAAKDISARLLFPLKVGDRVMLPPGLLLEINDRAQYIVRVKKIDQSFTASSSGNIMCFCDTQVDDTCHAFIVTGIGTKGKCAFLKPDYTSTL